MSKQYRVSLSASRTELTQVLARLQEDALEAPDRQLLIRLVQQLLGPSAGRLCQVHPLPPEGKSSNGRLAHPRPPARNKKTRTRSGRVMAGEAWTTTPGRSASPATIRCGNPEIVGFWLIFGAVISDWRIPARGASGHAGVPRLRGHTSGV